MGRGTRWWSCCRGTYTRNRQKLLRLLQNKKLAIRNSVRMRLTYSPNVRTRFCRCYFMTESVALSERNLKSPQQYFPPSASPITSKSSSSLTFSSCLQPARRRRCSLCTMRTDADSDKMTVVADKETRSNQIRRACRFLSFTTI